MAIQRSWGSRARRSGTSLKTASMREERIESTGNERVVTAQVRTGATPLLWRLLEEECEGAT